ncbi:MAG TPA: MBL fold metallo-hydrolase [Bryobacteraceae bacterium]|nr:MBL fold metallo-hydrolase [Bryobacteraceae bacterium]
MQLSSHCWAVTGLAYLPPWELNAGFIAGDHTTLVVDTAASALAAATIHGYATLARPGNRLLVINTERHFDHIGGNAYFRDRGAEILGHPTCARTDEEFRAEFAEFNAAITDPVRRASGEAEVFYRGTSLAVPTRFITEDTTLDLGGLEVRVLLTPGHTPANLVVFVPSEAVLYSGDCLVNGYMPNLACGAAPEWRQWLDSLARIERLAPATVVPGHGPVAGGAEVRELIEHVRRVLNDALGRG